LRYSDFRLYLYQEEDH